MYTRLYDILLYSGFENCKHRATWHLKLCTPLFFFFKKKTNLIPLFSIHRIFFDDATIFFLSKFILFIKQQTVFHYIAITVGYQLSSCSSWNHLNLKMCHHTIVKKRSRTLLHRPIILNKWSSFLFIHFLSDFLRWTFCVPSARVFVWFICSHLIIKRKVLTHSTISLKYEFLTTFKPRTQSPLDILFVIHRLYFFNWNHLNWFRIGYG